jgi:hypothetical protein
MAVQVIEQREWELEEAALVTRARRGVVGSPGARAAAAQRVARDQEHNEVRKRVCYPALLEARKTDRELLKPLEVAFDAIKSAPRFKHYHETETAWFNCSSAAGRFLRAAAPAMVMRPIAGAVRDRLNALSLNCMMADKIYAERYFFELSLYCDAVITKQDISFIFGQASLVLGPALSFAAKPVVAAGSAAAKGVGAAVAAHAAGAGAAKAATAGVESGAKLVTEKVVVSEPTYATIPVDDYKSKRGGIIGFVSNATSSADDPMRFTLAWLNFVTKEREPAEPIARIVKEFGGMSSCVNLLEYLTCSNL